MMSLVCGQAGRAWLPRVQGGGMGLTGAERAPGDAFLGGSHV